LLFEVLGVGHAGVLWLWFRLWNRLGRGSSIFSNFVLLVFLSKLLAGLFVVLLALAGLVTPSLALLLRVLTMPQSANATYP